MSLKLLGKLVGQSELIDFLGKIKDIEEPEIVTDTFTYNGKTYFGLLVREKEKTTK